MCGIAGVIYKDKKTHAVGDALTSMLESLKFYWKLLSIKYRGKQKKRNTGKFKIITDSVQPNIWRAANRICGRIWRIQM